MTYVKFPPSSVRTSFQNGCSALFNSPLRDFRRFYRTKPKTFKPALKDAFPDIPKNPPPSEWKRKGNSGFFAKYSNIADYDLAKKCVAGLAPKVYKNTTVIDVNPGPGIFSRALFEQINPKNYILFDRGFTYKPSLRPLAEASNGVMKHYDIDGWEFNSYSALIRRKLIEPEVQPIDSLNTSLLFVGNFTEKDSYRAEGFVAQLLSLMYVKAFFYYYGRVKTLVWMRSPGWEFLVAPPHHRARKKMTVLRELTCDARVIAKTDNLVGGGQIGEPIELEHEKYIVPLDVSNFEPEGPGALIELNPLPNPRSEAKLEELEYLLLKLFMVHQQPLDLALTVVAPGADILLKAIEPYDPDLTPQSMTVEHWIKLANAFHQWPFKPDVLEDDGPFESFIGSYTDELPEPETEGLTEDDGQEGDEIINEIPEPRR